MELITLTESIVDQILDALPNCKNITPWNYESISAAYINARCNIRPALVQILNDGVAKMIGDPAPSPWIAIKDRKPKILEGDTDYGFVIYTDGRRTFIDSWAAWDIKLDGGWTHWMPIPPLPKEKEVDPPSKSIQAFEQAWSKYSTIGPLQIMRGDTPLTTKENARKIWNAAILHVAERFMSRSDTTLPNLD